MIKRTLLLIALLLGAAHKRDVLNDVDALAATTLALAESQQRTDLLATIDQQRAILATLPSEPYSDGIADIAVSTGAADTTVDLDAAFADLEDDAALAFSVTGNTNPALFTSVTVTDGLLTLDYSDVAGTAVLSVRATDPGGLFAEVSFTVGVAQLMGDPDIFGRWSYAPGASWAPPDSQTSGATWCERAGQWVTISQDRWIRFCDSTGLYSRAIYIENASPAAADFEGIAYRGSTATADVFAIADEKIGRVYFASIAFSATTADRLLWSYAEGPIAGTSIETVMCNWIGDPNTVDVLPTGPTKKQHYRVDGTTLSVSVDPLFPWENVPSGVRSPCRDGHWDQRLTPHWLILRGHPDGSQVYEIDTSSGAVIGSLSIGGGQAENLAAKPDGSQILVGTETSLVIWVRQ